jgi:acyl carrier protein
MNDIDKRVIEIVIAHMGGDPDQVTPEASFLDDLGGDSLDVVELVMALEDEFGITISDSDIEKISTVQDAIRYVEAARSA